MSDYANTFGGAAKDAAQDIILGADFDTQFDAVAVASASKTNKIAGATLDYIVLMTAAGDLKSGGMTLTQLLDATALTGTTTAETLTATDGLILTGQGTSNDVVLKNDADAIALRVPTGSQNVVVEGVLLVQSVLSAVTSATVGTTLGVTGASTLTGLVTASAGIVSGGTIRSDTDGTDNLGTNTIRWDNVYMDTLHVTDGIDKTHISDRVAGDWQVGNISYGSTNATSYTKICEVRVTQAGSYKVAYGGYSGGGATSYIKTYKNGTAVGAQKTITDGSGADYQETSGWTGLVEGDLIQLYGDAGAGSRVRGYLALGASTAGILEPAANVTLFNYNAMLT
jgi:hypothetical protein